MIYLEVPKSKNKNKLRTDHYLSVRPRKEGMFSVNIIYLHMHRHMYIIHIHALTYVHTNIL